MPSLAILVSAVFGFTVRADRIHTRLYRIGVSTGYCTDRQFNVKGEFTQRRRTRLTTEMTIGHKTAAAGDEGTGRRKSKSVAEHMRQMTGASSDALQRPRKERDRFRRFLVDVVTQGECVPGGRKKVPAAETAVSDAVTPGDAVGFTDKVHGVPSTSSAPLSTGEKDLLR